MPTSIETCIITFIIELNAIVTIDLHCLSLFRETLLQWRGNGKANGRLSKRRRG